MNSALISQIIIAFLCLIQHLGCAVDFKAAREGHQTQQLKNDQLLRISSMANTTLFRPILDPILVPRVVGTQSHDDVKNYLVKHMENLKWDVEQDSFSSNTPIGRLQFTNVVARLNPQATRYLVLACHYDSKLMREGSFIGATDSAVPCAMMLHLATAMAEPLNKLKANLKNQTVLISKIRHRSVATDVSLKFIFFDGEEAFNTWGPNDSIYGARHLARKLEKTLFPANNRAGTTHLSRMDMLVLLDLIGAPDPKFYSYFRNTEKWYYLLVNAEKRLAESGQLTRYSYGMNGYPQQKYFQERSTAAGIEDDHIPFMRRGVPILHLITYPFPDVWHTEGDNLSALDFDTIDNLNKIMRVFVAEYLKLEV